MPDTGGSLSGQQHDLTRDQAVRTGPITTKPVHITAPRLQQRWLRVPSTWSPVVEMHDTKDLRLATGEWPNIAKRPDRNPPCPIKMHKVRASARESSEADSPLLDTLRQ